jgi:uncharacterized protein YbjT (DUF2867 family)
MSQTILIVGATGKLGEPVARQLLKEGYTVRVLARNPEKARTKLGQAVEIVQGDVELPASLPAALEGCYGVHISLAGGPTRESYARVEFQGTANVAQAAAQQGVKRLTYLSGASVREENSWFYQIEAKFKAETALRESGVAYSIFRCSWFMESLPNLVQGKRAMLIGRQPAPLHWIAAQDFARMVAQAYRLPEAANKTFYVYGPGTILMQQALETYCALVRPDAKVSQMPIWLISILPVLSRDPRLKDVAQLMAYFEHYTEANDPTEANTLLGAPTTTLQQWCQAQRQLAATS